jgi:hypothetical protein
MAFVGPLRQSGFALDLRAFVQRFNANADLVARKAAIDIFASIVKRTPVDTGRARANWQVGIGTAPSGEVTQRDKTGEATVSAGNQKLGTFKCGPSIWFANNLPYAVPLEYGWSKQAPGGMVRLAAAEFQQAIDKAVREVAR